MNLTRGGFMSFRRFIVAAAAAALASGAVQAQQKQVWKAADVHPLGYPTIEAIISMGKKLEKETNGRISIQMYHSMQLGGEKEMIEQAQVGALQIARVSVGALGPGVDDLNVFNLPFMFRNEDHMRAVIDGPIGDELLQKVSNSSARLIALGWMDGGTRNVYTSKPITKPADLKGLKVRMMGNPIFVETMNAMGGNGVAMGYNELYSALQTHVVDGADKGFNRAYPALQAPGGDGREKYPPLIPTGHQLQVVKVYSLTGHLIIP